MILIGDWLVDTGQRGLWDGFIVFLRVGAFMALLPAFGEQSVPMRVRLGLAIAFTLVLTPAVQPWLAELPFASDALPRLVLTEVIAGLAMGAALRFLIHALQIAGSIAAQSTSLSQILGSAMSVDPQPAMGQVMLIAGLALLALSGLHLRLVEYMVLSYALFPVGSFPDPAVLSQWGLDRVARVFALAFSLAAPFVVASFIYNLTLGVINRAMPQLMVAFVGAPVITAGGLLILMLSLPLFLGVWFDAVTHLLENPGGPLQ